MPLLRTGRNRIVGLLIATETCTYADAKATIWVASTTAAHDPASTWPAGSAIAATQESGYPVAGAASNIFVHRSVYSTAQANFQWEAFWLHTATASGAGATLNHAPNLVLGTKTSAQSWQITTCCTLTT